MDTPPAHLLSADPAPPPKVAAGADGDFHLKSMAVLRVAPDGAQNFSSVRFAPTHDVVTTRVFPGLERDDLALSLAGKRGRLSSRDFV